MSDPERSDVSPSRMRTVFVLVLTAVVAAHLVLVTAAAMPPNRYGESVQSATGYLSPYFTQNWRLFAPNPVSSDRSVHVQAAYLEDGAVRTTDWVDWTDVELDLVRHKLVGGRAGYVTNKLYTPLNSRHRALTDEQKHVVQAADPEQAPTWTELEGDVTDTVETPAQAAAVDRWLQYERAAASLATAVLLARDPDAEIIAVRYSLHSQGVTPYESRGASAQERDAARPEPFERIGGWREPLPPDQAQAAAVRGFDGRHR
ncbi:DUF5819 family protein [Aeromicrobium sp. CTD01-1L150]|uniref:DUF5819 family protein n=1 Tax=Aeromicrobium sp. CTD01-1L150 TaxID=3341830 RepID=UPI0035C12E97